MKKLTGILFLALLTIQAAFAQSEVVNVIQKNEKSTYDLNINGSRNTEKEKNIKPVNTPVIQLNEKLLNMAIFPDYSPSLRPEGIIYSETQRYVNTINPQKNSSIGAGYPGQRGPNQLIVYTPQYGLRTGTNEFGTEAIVENNMVVRLNGADSIIPYGGFVISGHGTAKNWITKNLQIGSKVYLDYSTKLLKVFLTPESLVFAANEKIKEVNGIVDYYKKTNAFYNDKKANELIEASKENLKKAEKKPEKTKDYLNEAMNTLNSALKNAIPYDDKELKGIWIRPVETNIEGIRTTLDRIQKAGITDIFLETYFHGKTIYPSKYLESLGVTSQRAEFIGIDPLEIWITEAHKRGIKVHIWFETFYVGNDNPQYNPNHILNIHPEWNNKRLLNYDSPTPVASLSEHNGYFLDPANPAVREYLLCILLEIIEKYKPDGINLDYIRYPQTVEPSYSNYTRMNWGYTPYARSEFKYIYGIDPIDINFGTPEWDLWATYRQGKISDFVKEVKNLAHKHNVKLTAVIFPDLRKCTTTKMQNWRTWARNHYVDGLTPLILTGDKNTANMLLNDVIKNTDEAVDIYPGLFVTFMGGTFDDLLVQIHKTREFNTKGAVLFDYAHLNDVYIDALTTRVFNKSYDDKKEIKTQSSKNYVPEVRLKTKEKKKRKSREK